MLSNEVCVCVCVCMCVYTCNPDVPFNGKSNKMYISQEETKKTYKGTCENVF